MRSALSVLEWGELFGFRKMGRLLESGVLLVTDWMLVPIRMDSHVLPPR